MGLAITVPLLHAAAVEMAAAPPAADEIHTFNVPAGPLDAALDHFAHTAGVNLYYDAALLSGLQSKGLSGNYSIASALSRLLAGSGIEAAPQPGGGYSLRKVPTAGNSSSEAVVLPLMTVSATIASADGSTDQGYRSEKVSQVGPWQGRVLQNLPYAITVIPEELIDNLQAITPDQVFRIAPTTHLSRVQAENDQPRAFLV
ncbi:STN domain-containing protein [Nitrosomonas europaea]|uniref:STN domain-containing protein n=1 Tax=Nitrosomonas europaea TaxID=915 RepID=UPI003263EB6F